MRTFALVALAAILVASGSLAASAGELTGGGWHSDRCDKPIAPAIDRTDAQSLNLSIATYNAYVGDVDRYVGCLKTEAEEDMRRIQDGFNAAQDEVQRDVDASRPRGTEVK